jgi:biopolymer transport protein ExbD
MGMSVSGKGGLNSSPNVTPFVDICLVLLVIFMVITPLLSRTLDVAVPPKDPSQDTPPPTDDQLILTIKGPAESPHVLLNREEIVGALEGVKTRMEELMKNRRDKVVFFTADNEVPYDYVIHVMDEMRAGGVDKIGLITDENLDVTGGPAAGQ